MEEVRFLEGIVHAEPVPQIQCNLQIGAFMLLNPF